MCRPGIVVRFCEMALRTRVWTAGKIVLLGVALVVTYALFAGAAMRLALKAREVQVPDLTNQTANEASAIAADLGLTLKVDDNCKLTVDKAAVVTVLAKDAKDAA